MIPSSRNDLATTLRTDCTITRSITDGRALFELAALGVREMRSVRRVLCQMRPPSVTQKRQGEYCSEFEQMLQGEKTMPGALAFAMRAQTDIPSAAAGMPGFTRPDRVCHQSAAHDIVIARRARGQDLVL